MISIKTLVFNPFAENTYIVYDDTKNCVIIDPGCYTTEEKDHLKEIIKKDELKPVALVNTHCHIDHVLGNEFVMDEFHLELQIPEDDEETYNAVPTYAGTYGFPMYRHIKADRLIKPDEKISFGNTFLKALYVPGHSKGHLAFVNEEDKICIGGDVLFNNSIGRTDLPGGDFNTLIDSIQQVLFKLPEDMTVYPGHGPTTSIGKEMRSNPFCALN